MTNISFNESSIGNVNDDNVALEIRNNGNGGGIKCTASVPGINESTEAGIISKVTGIAGIAISGESEHPGGVDDGLGRGGSIGGIGVKGLTQSKFGRGIWGEAQNAEGGTGVVGTSKKGKGVSGTSETDDGVRGESQKCVGVFGITNTSLSGNLDPSGKINPNLEKDIKGVGVVGIGRVEASVGVWGVTTHAKGGAGVVGLSIPWYGVHGQSEKHIGVYGVVTGEKGGKDSAGVFGETIHAEGGVGVFGKAPNGGIAARFEGNVHATGSFEGNHADCAEDFDIDESENIEPGTVMVLNKTGLLQPSCQEYDKKVAGIVSGAGGCNPAIVLDKQDILDQENGNNNKGRLPVALMGKVYCKVDARHSGIEIGDLLTTSSTKGHAMKAEDPAKAFGAVIGKALGSIKEGMGMIRVLVTLQ